jgi:hypothetical protein
MSPAAMTRAIGKTTSASPPVWGAPDIVEIDLVGSAAERQPVGERPRRHPTATADLERVRALAGSTKPGDRIPLLHIDLRVLVRDDLDLPGISTFPLT